MNSPQYLNMCKKAHSLLHSKYLITPTQINSNVISNIIYNEKLHIVSEFKEWLIYDDQNEFLKRFYNNNESVGKLINLFEFYEANSKIFPNYCILPESKYLFKNIKKKQKMLDNIEGNGKEQNNTSNTDKDNKSCHSNNTVNIFTSNIMHSLLTNSKSSSTDNSESFQKIIKIMMESGVDDINIPINEIKINNTTKHTKKFIKEISHNIKIDIKKGENSSNKQNVNKVNNNSKNTNNKNKMIFSTNIGKNKYIHKINIANIERNKVSTNKNKLSNTNNKSKSTSKTKTTLTERNNVKQGTKPASQHNNIIKSTNLIVSSSIDVSKIKTKEAKSMPKLSYKERLNSLNKLSNSSNNTNANKRIVSPQSNGVHYKNNNVNASTKIKTIAKANITKQQQKKPLSNNGKAKNSNNINNNNIKTKVVGYNSTLFKDRKIPSLHISFSKNFTSINNNNTKSKSKSKSKSPNSNSTSLNKKGNNNVNVKNSCLIKQNNLRTLIHKDIIASTEDGRHTERIKQTTKDKNINSIKSSLNTKQNIISGNAKNSKNNSNIYLISQNNNSNLNNNLHKKITSVASSYDYNKIHPKTARGSSNNNNCGNNGNNKKGVPKESKMVVHRIIKSNHYHHNNKNAMIDNNTGNKQRVLSASTNKNDNKNSGNNTNNNHKLLTSRGNSNTKANTVRNNIGTTANNKKQIVKKIKNFNEAIKTVGKSTSISSPYIKSSNNKKN